MLMEMKMFLLRFQPSALTDVKAGSVYSSISITLKNYISIFMVEDLISFGLSANTQFKSGDLDYSSIVPNINLSFRAFQRFNKTKELC